MTRLALRSAIPLALLAVLAVAGQVHAAGEVATQISIRPLEPVSVGDGDALIDLRVAGGPILANEPVELSIDGVYYRRTRTDVDGLATIGLPEDLTVGEHRLTAVYPGSTDRYAPSSTSAVLTVVPYQLTIQTVPALPGMAFTLDGRRFEAGDDGVARIAVGSIGDHQLAVLSDEYDVGGARAEFARWLPDSYGTEITVNVPHVGEMQAGFDVYLPVSQVFLDPAGGAVEASRVTSFTLRSSLGNVFTYPDGRERMYKASRVVRRSGGLESVDVRYNVTEVEVDGSNVVNAGQQRFYATPGATWRISLLLYSARVQSTDALFGFGAGKSVEVTFPNGKVEVFQAQDGEQVVIPWLARGIYRMTMADAPGWAPSMPVALSRDQEVELRVVSFIDMFIGVTLFLGVVFGLLHRGRPHLLPETMRAAGRGASRVGLPVPAAVRAAAQPPAEAQPPSPTTGDAGEPQPGTAQASANSRMAPILASIAAPDPLPDRPLALDLSRRPLPGSREVSEALLNMAPGLLGPGPAVPAARPASPPAPRSIPAAPAVAARSEPASQPVSKPAPIILPAVVPVPAVQPPTPEAAASTRRAPRPRTAGTRSRTSKAGAGGTTKAPAKPRAASKAKAPAKPKSGTRASASAKAKTTTGTRATARTRAAAKSTSAASVTSKAKAPSRVKARSTTGTPTRARASRKSAPESAPVTGPVPVMRQAQLSELGIRDPGQPSPAEAMQQSAAEVAVPVQSCRNCGLELWVGAQFCRRCGQPSGDTTAVEAQPGSANGRSARFLKGSRTEATAAVGTDAGSGRGSRSSKRGKA